MTANTDPGSTGDTPGPTTSSDQEALDQIAHRQRRELEAEEDPAKELFADLDEALHPDDAQ